MTKASPRPSSVIELLLLFFKRPLFLGLMLPVVALILYSATFLPFLADDALISLRYAQNLLDGQGLIWTPGLAVEGYSNLSWILAVAGLGTVGIDLIWAARLLSALLYISILSVNYLYWRPQLTDVNRQFFYLAQFAFAFSATTGVWLVGGLEQPLVAACIAWSLYFLLKDQKQIDVSQSQPVLSGVSALWGAFSKPLLFSSLALGGLCSTRPDSPLVCVCFALALFIINGFNAKTFFRCSVLAIFPLLVVGGQLAFRLSYYGEWVAMPALIKVQPSLTSVMIGLLYVSAGLFYLAPFSYYCLRGILSGFRSEHRPLVIVTSTTLVVWLIYLVLIGGDIFPAFRHFTLVSVFLSFSFPVLQYYFSMHNKIQFSFRQISLMALLYIGMQWLNPSTAFARGHLWVWDGQVIAKAMQQGFGDKKPKVAVDAAGALPYWSQYPSLDMLGLNDYHIAHAAPSTTIKYVGHQFGDGVYVMQQQPDIVNFCFPRGLFHPCWKSGREMWSMADFHQRYVPVRMSASDPYYVEGVQWLSKYSPLVGIVHDQKQWTIPAYFFSLDADIKTQAIKPKRKMKLASESDTPAHLLRSYILTISDTERAWAIDVPSDKDIVIDGLDIKPEDILTIDFVPASLHLEASWEVKADGLQLILHSTSGEPQPLVSVIVKLK